jgi:GGDEF domain-containing protein
LPAGRLIEDQLRRVIREQNWALMDIRINHFEPFKDVYGFIAANDVLRFAGMLLGEVVDELGNAGDFIGHAGGDNFVIITGENAAPLVSRRIKDRFNEEVQTHYNFMDRQLGYIVAHDDDGDNRQFPLMTIALGMVSPSTHQFADIREITEMASEERRKDANPSFG